MSKRPAIVALSAQHPEPCPGCGRQKGTREGDERAIAGASQSATDLRRWVAVRVQVVGGEALKSFCSSCGPLVVQYMTETRTEVLSLRTDLEVAINRPSWWRRHVARRGKGA